MIPAERKLTVHSQEARLLRAVDDEHLEQRREAELRIQPRNCFLDDSVLVTLKSRNVFHGNRAVLHGVQMTPAVLAGAGA